MPDDQLKRNYQAKTPRMCFQIHFCIHPKYVGKNSFAH